MKLNQNRRHSFTLAASTALLLGAFPFASAQADTTGYLSPEDGPGTYTAWVRSGSATAGTEVNDFVGCDAGDTTNWATSGAVAVGDRASGIITVPVTIPDGATIDSIDIQVCQARGALGADGATFQMFARVDGADTDSGVDIVTATPDTNLTPNTQTVPVGVVKSGATTLEVGVIKTNATNATRVFSLAAQINFTPAGPPVASKPVPVFGPFGLLFTILGMGLIGVWQARRKS